MRTKGNLIYYVFLATVIITWGLDPIINSYFYKYFSASALSSVSTLASFLLFLFMARKKLKKFNSDYFKIAFPICSLNAVACLCQRIGLQYTTPASCAFLEHLSCVVVPIAMFFILRKKPKMLQVSASILCLVGCFVFSGLGNSSNGMFLGKGELLCATAGILSGICIAVTGVFTKNLDINLFMTVHMLMYFIISLSLTIALNLIRPGGIPIEEFKFSFDPKIIIPAILFGLFSVGICWLLRTEAIRHINPMAVAVLSPFAAVITGIVSVILNIDTITKSFACGAAIILISIVLSVINDILEIKNK